MMRVSPIARAARLAVACAALCAASFAPAATRENATALYLAARATVDADSAAAIYKNVIAKFPRDSMAAWSLLRLAQYELARGKSANADTYVRRLRKQFPKSAAAAQAAVLPEPYNPMTPEPPPAPREGSVAAVHGGNGEGDATPGDERVRGSEEHAAKPAPAPAHPKAAPHAVAPPPQPSRAAPKEAAGGTTVGTFGVQLGAFIVASNANRLRERAVRVTPTEIVKRERPGATLYVVIAGRCETRDEAEKLIPRLTQETGVAGVVVRREP